MFDEWYRVGNFFTLRNPDSREETYYQCPKHQVRFRNISTSCIAIKGFKIEHTHDGKTHLYISSTTFYKTQILNHFKTNFKKESLYDGDLHYCVCLTFKSNTNLSEVSEKIIKVLSDFNISHQRVEFSKDLFEEFTNIFNFIQSKNEKFKRHILSDQIPSVAIVNPFLRKSIKLINYLHPFHFNDLKVSVVFELLASGEDPNQTDQEGITPLSAIMLANSTNALEIFQLLLYFNADVTRRPFSYSHPESGRGNAIEDTKRHNKPKFFEMIMYKYSSLRASLNEPKLSIEQIETKSKESEIVTSITFSNHWKINSRIVTSKKFNRHPNLSKERNEVWQLFCAQFEHLLGKDKLFAAYESGFSEDDNKWIDIITDSESNKVIGFVSYQLLNQKTRTIVKTEYIGIDRHSMLRGCGGTFFGRRAAFAIKLLKNKSIVQAYFLAISYFSYQPMEQELCTPKHQSKSMLKSNQETVKTDFDNVDVPEIVNGCYVEHSALPKVKSLMRPSSKKGFSEDCFDKFILWDQGNKAKFTRGAVVSTIIGKRSIENFSQRIYSGLQFNVVPHVIELALALNDNRDEFLPLFKGHTLAERAELQNALKFFQNEDELFFGDPKAKL